jgi:hypothetical protein
VPNTVPPEVPANHVRLCHVCRVPVAYFVPLPSERGTVIPESALVKLPNAGKSKRYYACIEHDDAHMNSKT